MTGLILGHKSHLLQSASSRIFERTNWRTIEFLLENAVFLLIGLQVRPILEAAGDRLRSGAREDRVAVSGGDRDRDARSRPIWVFPATYLPRLIPRIRAVDPNPPWTVPAAISWAGMRGAVTLAAAFMHARGHPAARGPRADRAVVVVGATLLVQGLTLPWVAATPRGCPAPTRPRTRSRRPASHQRAASAGLATAGRDPVVRRLRLRDRTRPRAPSSERAQAMWERLGGERRDAAARPTRGCGSR